MLSIYELKPAFQNLLRPLVKRLYGFGITANHVTISTMLLSLALSLYIYFHYKTQPASALLLLIPFWMFLRMAFNAIDGMLAREFGLQSKLGAFYNELCDIISDTALYICLISLGFISNELLLFMVFLSILSEYTGVMAPLIGMERCYDGPMGKSDRAFWISLIAIFFWLSHYFNLNALWTQWLANGAVSVMCLLLVLTIYNRIKKSL